MVQKLSTKKKIGGQKMWANGGNHGPKTVTQGVIMAQRLCTQMGNHGPKILHSKGNLCS